MAMAASDKAFTADPDLTSDGLTPRKKRKFGDPNLSPVNREVDMESEQIDQNGGTVSSDTSESSSDESEDSDAQIKGNENHKQKLRLRMKKSQKNKFVPRNIIHNFRFPVILEDIGKAGSAEQLADYDFDINRLMAQAQVGRIKTSKKISTKKYILDCFSYKQRENILRLVQLRTPGGGYIPIKARVPEPTTEGVIGPIGKNVSHEDLQDKISEYNTSNPKQSVSNFERLKRYQDGVIQETAFFKLTFKCSDLPDSVKLGCNFYPVEPNRREPMLCSKCFRLGHTKNKCHKKNAVCGKCLGPRHEFGEQECPVDKSNWKCLNCNSKGHSAAWPRCPQKLKLKKALLLQSKHYMPLAAALEIVTGSDPQSDHSHPVSNRDYGQKPPIFNSGYPPLTSKTNKQKLGWKTYTQEPPHRADTYPFQEVSDGQAGESSRKGDSAHPTPEIETLDQNKNKQLKNSLDVNTILEAIKENNSKLEKRIDSTVKSLQKETDKKISVITSSLNDIKAQNEQKLKTISDFVKSKQKDANTSEKIVLDIIDSIRQAAEGRPEGIFAIAKKFSRTNEDISQELRTEISVITQNITF